MEGKVTSLYTVSASNYEAKRGISSLLPVIIKGSVPRSFEELSVLDIGGGTGLASELLLNAGVGSVTVMDPNKPMLDIADEKLSNAIDKNRAFTKLAGLPDMDFEDCQFDAAILLSCIHFVDELPRQKEVSERPPVAKTSLFYPKIFESFQEIFRVLKPGGVMIVVSMLPHQRRWCTWYSEYFPSDVANGFPRYPTKEQMDNLISESGFTEIQHFVDLNNDFMKPTVFENPLGIENEEWRVTDSNFLCLTQEEIEDMVARVRRDNENGDLEKLIERTKNNLKTWGDTTFFIAKKK